MSNYDENIKSNPIREIYLESGMSYNEMAEITGLKYNTLANYLTGRRKPSKLVIDMVRKKMKRAMKRKNKESVKD